MIFPGVEVCVNGVMDGQITYQKKKKKTKKEKEKKKGKNPQRMTMSSLGQIMFVI